MVTINNTYFWVAGFFIALSFASLIIFIVNRKRLETFHKDYHENVKTVQVEPKKLTASEHKVIAKKVIREYEDEVKESTKEHQKTLMYSKPYHPYKHISKLKLRYWHDWWIDRKMTARAYLIIMKLNNGFYKIMVQRDIGDGSFLFMGGQYVIDESCKFYVLDAKLYALFYHQEMALPLDMKVPVQDIKETMEKTNITEVEYALNPKSLERFQTAKVAEGIMQGQGTAEILKQQRLLIVVLLIITTMTLGYLLFSTGAFEGVTNTVSG